MSDEDDQKVWDNEHDAEVIPFPRGQFERTANERESRLDTLPVRPEHRSKSKCDHARSWVNEADRTVECRDCGVALDPIRVLAKLADRREWLVRDGMMLRNEATHLRTLVEKLKRDEKNAKARLRNAEHPATKEARLAMGEAEKVLWDARGKLAFDPTLEARCSAAWSRLRRAAEALKPARVLDKSL